MSFVYPQDVTDVTAVDYETTLVDACDPLSDCLHSLGLSNDVGGSYVTVQKQSQERTFLQLTLTADSEEKAKELLRRIGELVTGLPTDEPQLATSDTMPFARFVYHPNKFHRPSVRMREPRMPTKRDKETAKRRALAQADLFRNMKSEMTHVK